MYKVKVRIADLTLLFALDYEIEIPEQFIPFLAESEADYRIDISRTEALTETKEIAFYQGEFFNSFLKAHEIRYYHPDIQHRDEDYLSADYDLSNKAIKIKYLPVGYQFINSLSNLFFHIGLEEIFMHEKRMILHSCCMKTTLGGLLFSGPSGIGKSTQGELWKKYEHSFMINGDRPIIYKKEDVWKAYGSPYAGSSRCYVQDSTDIRAIIMLKQAPECRIARLSKADAFRKVYSMLTVCDWSADFMNQLLEQLELLIHDIPVYQLECTPDQIAVDLLKKTLQNEEA